MAAPAPSDKVKDKEYKNWLKVTLALYYMKSGLHTFIQSEIDGLHQSLVQKIYGGQTVPLPPCTMCDASHVKRNKYTGVWAFQKQCRSYCDAWLYELIILHTNPKSEKIYWENSNVPSWPFKPWECAKVFMPRGQLPSNTRPDECDAQALLTLLASCKHFHHKLSPQGPGLTHTISTVRNKVMHDGEMKVSDADRTSFIQQIIQFLEDPVSLMSLEDCKAAVDNIHKIDNDSVDVFFNVDLEMKALQALVTDVRQELGMQKKTLDTVDSLKEEYRQLREQLTKRLLDVEIRMDTTERDVQSVKEQTDTAQQQQEKKLQEMHTNITSQQTERFKDVEIRMDTIKRDVQSVKEQTDTVLQQQEKKLQEMHTTITSQQTERIEDVEIRMNTIERDVQSVKEQTDTAQQQQEKKLQEMHTTITSEQTERFEDVEIRMNTIERDVQSVKEQTDTVLQQLKNKCQESTETTSASTKGQKKSLHGNPHGPALKRTTKQKGTKGQKRRLYGPAPKRTSRQQETPTKRRPESDGLRQLKSQTDDKLDTIRGLGCIPTTQAAEAKKLLEEKRSVVIKGNPGEGKTTVAFHLIDNEMYRDRRVVVYCLRDWKKVDTEWVDIVVLEDILGKYDFDPGFLQEWMVYLPTIQEHVDTGKLQVIITSRVDIMSKAYSKLGSLKLFSDHLSLTLSSEHLNNSEKMSILNKELQRHVKNMEDDEKNKCIANFSGLIGFPQCCLLFAGDSNLFAKGHKFFRCPEQMFFVNINELKTDIFVSLAFIFCHGKIYEEYLSPETMPKSSVDLFMELASHLHISKEKSDISLLRDIYESFEGLYIEKSISYEIISGVSVKRSSICFSHATVCEAVGQVLAKHSLEMVVKHGDPEYLYQRTYTAEAKDRTSENVFLPVSMYQHMAERMVHDVVEKRLVKSVVKHFILKQHLFLMKLKDALHKGNRIGDFFMANPFKKLAISEQSLLNGECFTFLQCILQNDEDVVKLVYSQLMEFLACAHTKNSSDCWQCKEKQMLLELALYYHHFDIAEKLIRMNAIYTHLSLCNAARHGNLSRVQTILGNLKRSQVFNPECNEAKEALCRAYISENQDVIESLLQEGITLDSMHVVHGVQHGDINVLMKVVEHLKRHNKWHPHGEQYSIFRYYFSHFYISEGDESVLYQFPCSVALYITYCNEKFDMADYLLKSEAKVSLDMLASVSKNSSKEAVVRVIQNLKVTRSWNPHCEYASKALGEAYGAHKYDVCDLLIQEGVSLTMMNFCDMVGVFEISLEAVKKAVQHLKDTDNWDPKCNDASNALGNAYGAHKYDECDLLIQEGVSLTMKNLPDAMGVFQISLEAVKKAVQHLKDTDNWDPKCDDASKALRNAYIEQKYDVCDLLIQEGVSLTMMNFCDAVGVFEISLEAVKKAVQHLKDTDNWDPKCDDASEALGNAYIEQKYDMCDLLIQEGVSLTMMNFCDAVGVFEISLEAVKKAVQHLKDTDNWDPKCDDASEALGNAYGAHKYDVCDLLIQEGVSLTMMNFCDAVGVFEISLEAVKKAVQHLKDTDNWDPKCRDASKALRNVYRKQKYDVCDLLIQEGVSPTMKYLPHVVWIHKISLEAVKKGVQHLKDTDNWDPKCDDASEALGNAYIEQKYDVCDLLIQEGVSLTMKYLPGVVGGFEISLEAVKKAVQHLKDTDNWDPKCDDASEALGNAYIEQKYDMCDLLIQEGVSLTMMNFCDAVGVFEISLEAVKKAVQHLKDTDNWDPKCDDASEALGNAYIEQKYDMCDLLIQEGVSLTMMNFCDAVGVFEISLEAVKKAVQHLKDTDNWDPKCDDASEALGNAYIEQKYDMCDLLIQEGVSLTMKYLPGVVGRFEISLEAVKKAVQHLKDTDNWDPKCDDASETLGNAYREQEYDVCDLLIQEGVSLTMKYLPHVVWIHKISLEAVKKAVQHLKDTDNWDPKCDDASEALGNAYGAHKYDVCDLLIQEGVSLTMKYLPHVVWIHKISLEAVKKAVQHLKDTDNWDPKCDDASEALGNAYIEQKYDVCDLLIQEGVSLTMKYLPRVVGRFEISLEAVEKAVQHLKDTDNWDPKCHGASKALENAYIGQQYDVCDLLIQEGVLLSMKNLPGVVYSVSLESVKNVVQDLNKYEVFELLIQESVSLTMKNLPHMVRTSKVSLEPVKKAMEHLKDTENWDPKCYDASKALANAYSAQMCDVCDLLLEEGVSLVMKNLPGVVGGFEISLEAVKKVMQHLKDTKYWDPKCDDASEALANAYSKQKYDVCDLLIMEGVSLTMKTLAGVMAGFQVSLEAVKKTLQHLKDTDNWDPKCDDASKALENAYIVQKYDVCDMLIQEGFSLSMNNLPGVVYSVSLESVKKAIQHLNKYEVFELLTQEGVSLTLKNLPCVVGRFQVSLEAVKKAMQHLKDTENWDPKCDDASKALANASSEQMYDVYDLLVQEGV